MGTGLSANTSAERAPHPDPLRASFARLDPAKSGERERKQSWTGHARLPSATLTCIMIKSLSHRNLPMSLQAYLAFVAACIALALLPGPVVTLLIANGLRHGTRAALINCAGAQTGLPIVIGIVAIGL